MASSKGPGNTQKITVNQNYFTGGVSIDPKLGIANSFYYSQNLDFRSKPSQMSVLPAPQQLSNSLSGLITAMEQDLNGVRWGLDTAGNLYKFDTNDNISVEARLSENGSAGLLYNQITDQLYVMGQTKASTYGQVTTGNPGQPDFNTDVFAQSSSIINGCTQVYDPTTGNYDGAFRSTASTTYPVPTGLTEVSSTFCTFSPDIEPGYSIQVYIASKGTGNWTLTLHDPSNNTLASVTKNNGTLTNGAYNEFVFGKQVRVLVGGGIASGAANYHFHLTSTVNDGTVNVVPASSTNANYATGDMQSIQMLWSAYRLVQTQNGWHPTALFGVKTGTGNGQALCIGNGQYLSTYNFSNDTSPSNNSWIRHQLVFKHGYEVCGLSTNNQYLVIACERRSKTAGRTFQDGALYFWDGTTAQPTFVIDIPMGAPYGLYTFNNVTYFACAGSLYAWSGGQTVVKVRQLAYQNTDFLGTSDQTIVNPNMFTSRYNLLMMGYPSSTTNTNINYGVWSWGSVELTFPNSYGLSYTLSNGYLNNTTPISGLQIGCVYNFVDTMYVSWQYTDANAVVHYGIDRLNNSSPAATSFSWKSLIFDGGARYKQKISLRIKISFTALPAGSTITPFYILDRGTQVNGTAQSITNSTSALIEINKRFHEIQYGFSGTLPSGTMSPPAITGISLEADPNSAEADLRPDG